MGGFKRFSEKIKQSMGFKASKNVEWRPTSNERNNLMLAEARKFAFYLRNLHTELTSWEKNTESTLATLKGVLGSALPKAYTAGQDGIAHAVDQEVYIVGHAVNQEAITAAAKDMQQHLMDEVLKPIEQWLSAYKTIKEKNAACEVLRLDLDAKRRDTAVLADKHLAMSAKQDPKAEDILARQHMAADKQNRLQLRYVEEEGQIFNALLSLIKDSASLRDHIAKAIDIMQRTLHISYGAFDLSSPVPLPTLPQHAVLPDWQAQGPAGVTVANSQYVAPPPSAKLPLAAAGPVGPAPPTSSGGAFPTATSAGGLPSPFTSSSGAVPTSQSTHMPITLEAEANPFDPPAVAAPTPAAKYMTVSNGGVAAPVTPATNPVLTKSDLPPPPAWYNEARQHTISPAAADSDEETANPFTATTTTTTRAAVAM